ncbi:MAG: DUF2127 domain-containing protein [Chloroflexota bacterium]
MFGRPLGIGLIIIQKCLAAGFFLLAAVFLFYLYRKGFIHPFQRFFGSELLEDPHDLLANFLISRFPAFSKSMLLGLSLGAGVYCVLEAIEGVGLIFGRFWVEVLIVGETAAFLPYEVYEMTRRFSWLKIVTFAVNAVILVYLVWRYLKKRAEHETEEQRWLLPR